MFRLSYAFAISSHFPRFHSLIPILFIVFFRTRTSVASSSGFRLCHDFAVSWTLPREKERDREREVKKKNKVNFYTVRTLDIHWWRVVAVVTVGVILAMVAVMVMVLVVRVRRLLFFRIFITNNGILPNFALFCHGLQIVTRGERRGGVGG